MKSALYYYGYETTQDDFLEQLLTLKAYAVSIGTTPCALYLDHIKDKNSHPAYDQMLSDAKREYFSVAIAYDLPPHLLKCGDLCILTVPKS